MIIFFRRMRKRSVPNFIQKTWEMMEQQANWPVVSWNNQGTCFQVHNQTDFAQTVLPIYFKHSNFASFIRQLNMYNFHKRKTATGNTEFFHKLFRKNHQELLIGIKRKPSEAEINEAEQLIKQLAPECLEENSSEGLKSPTQLDQTQPAYFLPDFHMNLYTDLNQMWFLTPMMLNPYEGYQWGPQKKIKTNIILQWGNTANAENDGYQITS